MARIPGAVDVHLHQVVSAPSLSVAVDRTRAAELGLRQREVANDPGIQGEFQRAFEGRAGGVFRGEITLH